MSKMNVVQDWADVLMLFRTNQHPYSNSLDQMQAT